MKGVKKLLSCRIGVYATCFILSFLADPGKCQSQTHEPRLSSTNSKWYTPSGSLSSFAREIPLTTKDTEAEDQELKDIQNADGDDSSITNEESVMGRKWTSSTRALERSFTGEGAGPASNVTVSHLADLKADLKPDPESNVSANLSSAIAHARYEQTNDSSVFTSEQDLPTQTNETETPTGWSTDFAKEMRKIFTTFSPTLWTKQESIHNATSSPAFKNHTEDDVNPSASEEPVYEVTTTSFDYRTTAAPGETLPGHVNDSAEQTEHFTKNLNKTSQAASESHQVYNGLDRDTQASLSSVSPDQAADQDVKEVNGSSTDQGTKDFRNLHSHRSKSDSFEVSQSPASDYQNFVNNTIMAQQVVNTTGTEENQEKPLLITRIEDPQEDLNLLLYAVHNADEITNSTNTTNANATQTDFQSERRPLSSNASDMVPTEVSKRTKDDEEFLVPDDDCVYDAFGTSGILRYPDAENFPVANDQEFLTCRWRLRVPDGPNIKLSFDRLALSMGVEYLEVALGVDGELKRRHYTGTKSPRDLVTMGTRLWLTARIRNDNIENKIVLSFTQTVEDAIFPGKQNYSCGDILTDFRGNITSPGYPGHYSNYQECSWHVLSPNDSVIHLIIRQFDTEIYDHLTIGVGRQVGVPNSKLLTLYGHLQQERETVVPASTLWMHFTSDDSDTETGFSIEYQILPREICNNSNIHTDEEGEITSVDYPRVYPVNSECTWYIRAPPGAYVKITFTDLFIQDDHDFVLIGEGKELFGGRFTTYTGNETNLGPIRLNSSDVWVHFTSDHLNGDLPYRGFRLSYRIVYPVREENATTPTTATQRGDQDNSVLKDIPVNDQGHSRVLTIPLSGVKDDQLDRKLVDFRSMVAHLLNERCDHKLKSKCRTKGKVKGDAIRVLGTRQDQGRLFVEVRVEADITLPSPAMAEADYEELERLFHSDLQSLDLQDENTADDASSHLPEWLIGVIVVVILLIIAFFAMVVYSLMKERKKGRAGSYGGTTSTGSVCEDLEVGKTDGSIRITAFSLEQAKDAEAAIGQAGDGPNGATWTLDAEVASTLQRRQHGPGGCMNPAFIDDDAEKDDEQDDGKTIEETKKEDGGSRPNGKTPSITTGSSQGSTSAASSSSPKGAGEEFEMNGHKNEGQENGHVVKQTSEESTEKEESTDDQETALDEEDGGSMVEKKVDDVQNNTDQSAESKAPSNTSGPRQLEVVLDRDPPPADPQTCVMVHMDKQGEPKNENVLESSTDEKDDGTGMSTNL